MLPKILAMIEEEGNYNPNTIARRLGVSPELVEQALELLVQKGYLQPVEGCSDGTCGGCAVQADCKVPKPRVWVRVN